jgi:hypothetical protein
VFTPARHRYDPATRAYAQRHRAEGKTIMRSDAAWCATSPPSSTGSSRPNPRLDQHRSVQRNDQPGSPAWTTLTLLAGLASLWDATAMASLRVATWNIAGGRREGSSMVDLAAVLAGVRAVDADLLAVQEVDRQLARSDRADQPRAIAEARGAGWFWSYAPALVGDDFRPLSGPDPDGPAYGTLLVSGPPLEAVEQLRFRRPAAASSAPR